MLILLKKERVLIGPFDYDKPEGRIGLFHGMDCLGDIPILIGFPFFLWDSRYCTHHRFIQISSDGKPDSLLFTIVDNISLIGSAVGSQSGDLLSFGHLPDTVLDKGKVSASRSDIAIPKLIS